MDLRLLEIDLDDCSDDEAFEKGRQIFETEYAGCKINLYDGSPVVFHKDRYEHAFKTSPNRSRNPYSKAKVARDRISRIRWIKEVLAGNVSNTECWLIRSQEGNRQERDKLMIAWDFDYIVWLWPLKNGGWKFSSAYNTSKPDIRRYTTNGVKIKWEKKDAP